MKEGKSLKLNGQQQHQNGHLGPFKFAKLLDPEASWDKVLSVSCVLRPFELRLLVCLVTGKVRETVALDSCTD